MLTTRTYKLMIGAIIILTILATTIGLFANATFENLTVTSVNGDLINLYGKGIYHNDSVTIASQAKAQDLLTLILGVPLLGLSMVYTNKNSLRGKLFLLGTLGYFLYSYTSYVFLAQYNQLFIVYIALTSLTFFAFLICFQSFDVAQVKAAFSSTFPRRKVAIALLFFAFMMSFRALAMILPSVFANIIPAELEHYTSLVIQALDLTVLLPTTVIAGILLLKNHPLGYFLTTIVVVKMSTLGLAVLTMLAFMAAAGLPVVLSEVILFTVVSIFLLLLLYTTFKHIRKGS